MKFLMLDGSGDPNQPGAFHDAIQALYSLSYGAKFMLKKAGVEFKVSPLEGLWGSAGGFVPVEKVGWHWTAMIRQTRCGYTGGVREGEGRGDAQEASTLLAQRAPRVLPRGFLGADHAHRAVQRRSADDRAAARVHQESRLPPIGAAPRDLSRGPAKVSARAAQDPAAAIDLATAPRTEFAGLTWSSFPGHGRR
jgi:hypothetical protein